MIQSDSNKMGITVKKTINFWLILIISLSFLFRFVSLSSFPVGFNADEASFGYDSYSILKTGRDQWGNFLPIVLKSFGDYKSPLYSYLLIPFISVLDLTKFAVRLPNVLVGTLAVWAVYLLTKKISSNEKVSLIAALLLAVNPWHVMMSRGAFEANLITFFVPIGIYFFLLGLEKPKFLTYSALLFGVGLFSYHSAKLIIPMVILGLLIIYRQKLTKIGFKKLIIPAIFFSLFFIGMIYTFALGGGSRISERSITKGALEEGAEKKIKLIQSGTNPIVARLIHNKYRVVVNRFTDNYTQYFSNRFLFKEGAGEYYYGMIPGRGVLYIFEGILILGAATLFFDKKYKNTILALTLWLLIAPLPAALSTGVGFSGHRAEGMLPIFQIIAAFGFLGWTVLLKRFSLKVVYGITAVFLIITIYRVVEFVELYFQTPPLKVQRQMLVGSLEVGRWIGENGENRNILVSRSVSEPQIFIAFANKHDPYLYQESTFKWGFDESNVAWVDQIPEYRVEKYLFKSIDWPIDSKTDSLIVARPEEFPKDVLPVKIFNYLDGTPSIWVVDTNQKIYAKAN